VIVSADSSELILGEAVETYVFNSQIVSLPDGSMALIAPIECRDHARVGKFLQRVLATSPIRVIHYQDVRQSMNNGGGPACLRLRVAVTDEELKRIHPGVIFTNELHAKLKYWIERYYRDDLAPVDLADPSLRRESDVALNELATLLGIPGIYDFTNTPA
jgi:succinylarginine dihydrolase